MLCGSGPAWSQTAFSFGGPVSVPLQYQVVNTNLSQVPISGSTTTSTSFSLSSIFRLPSLVGSTTKPKLGSSNFPTYSQLPDKNYFAPFNMHRATQIAP
jgi:hypothetical protein